MELDKDIATNELLESPVVEPESIDIDEDEFDDDLPIDDFDNLDDYDDETDEEDDEGEYSPATESDYENEDDEEEESGEPESAKPKLSKAEIKLIALKNENKVLQQEKLKLESQMQEKATAKEKEEIRQSLIDNDYDPDVAEKMAADEIRMRRLEEKQAVLDFRDSNDELFAKYPQARQDVNSIMRNAKATGMTAEQICRGLYGSPQPINDVERRAMDAVRGNIKSKETRTPNTQQSRQAELTSRELSHKARLERNFLDGEKMTTEDYRKFINRKKSTVNERRIY